MAISRSQMSRQISKPPGRKRLKRRKKKNGTLRKANIRRR